MAQVIPHTEAGVGISEPRVRSTSRGMPVVTPTFIAFTILRVGFTALPIIAGADKFFHMLVNWDQYLSPQFASMLGGNVHQIMQGVGVVEIVAGLVVAIVPRWGAYLVAAWLLGIILNLLLIGSYFDIALRDFGLALGALALSELARNFMQSTHTTRAA